jgi:hypothetical protein
VECARRRILPRDFADNSADAEISAAFVLVSIDISESWAWSPHCTRVCRSRRPDQIVPIGASAMLSSKLVKGSTLKVYPGFDHGMCSTHKNEVNEDLLAFIKS